MDFPLQGSFRAKRSEVDNCFSKNLDLIQHIHPRKHLLSQDYYRKVNRNKEIKRIKQIITNTKRACTCRPRLSKRRLFSIVKDETSDLNSPSNYRGITLLSPFGSLFESAIRLKFGYLFLALEFGFKQGMSTSHAMYALKNSINYFMSKGSKPFVTFIDLSKALDLISHYGLFIKLMKNNVPLCFIRLIIYWYFNMSVSCKQGNSMSRTLMCLAVQNSAAFYLVRLLHR